MTDFLQIQTTVDAEKIAQQIASTLVEQRLAACVQVVGPMTSTYRWQGAIETSQEWLCIAKTSREKYPAVEEMIRQLHTYDVPEIVATPIVEGSCGYLDWLERELQ